jgi:hypothetical protein
MPEELDELRTACHSRPAASEADKISEGESLWMVGSPAAADAGYIGLSMGEGHSVIVSESSILEVVKDNNLYLIRVKADAAVLARVEAVLSLRNTQCACSDASPTLARPNTGGGRAPTKDICGCTCVWEFRCAQWIGSNGVPGMFCIPVPVCTSNCTGGGTVSA